MLVSIILPMYNAEAYLEEALQSIFDQTWKESLEISIFNDSSTDNSVEIVEKWKMKFQDEGIQVILGNNKNGSPGGVGYAKNKAIEQSTGKYLCFLDADDVMLPKRIEKQLEIVRNTDNLIVGCNYTRIPEGSTERYTQWSNGLTENELYTQIYTSFGPTIINPTWFYSRQVFTTTGMFTEKGKGYPEDLDFFYRHLRNDGKLYKVNEILLIYRYHENAATFSVHEDTIWNLRMKELQNNVLNKWNLFSIWNAGKQGRKFFRSLEDENRQKVKALYDVDQKKIEKNFYTCEMVLNYKTGKPYKIPVLHFENIQPPFIICMKLNLTNGEFEKNLKSLNFIEGKDYFHFN